MLNDGIDNVIVWEIAHEKPHHIRRHLSMRHRIHGTSITKYCSKNLGSSVLSFVEQAMSLLSAMKRQKIVRLISRSLYSAELCKKLWPSNGFRSEPGFFYQQPYGGKDCRRYPPGIDGWSLYRHDFSAHTLTIKRLFSVHLAFTALYKWLRGMAVNKLPAIPSCTGLCHTDR